MANIKYHINKAGEVRLCNASLMPCKFKEHYDNEKEALLKAEEILSSEQTFISTLNKFDQNKKQKTVEGLLDNKKFETLDKETKKAIVSSILRMDNNNKDQKLWKAIHDSTPVGQLFLRRLNTTSKEKRKKLAKEITELSEKIEYDKNLLDFESFNKPMKKNNFTSVNENLNKQPSYVLKEAEHQMTVLSATWMSNLTAKEIDTINWITGHGSGILNKHMNNEEHALAHQYDKKFLDEKEQLFKSAMSKAPELDEPIVFYRGTKYKHAIKDELSGIASSSYGNNIALNFANNKPNAVVLEIKTKKVPSVVAMSEWGMSELEIFAPLGKYKQIGEFTSQDGTHIVQVEYISE